MQYDVITIDTQVIFKTGFKLESGLLAQLRQFRTGPTRFVLSNVVRREIVKNLTTKTEEANQTLQSSLSKALEFQLQVAAPDLSAIDARAVAKGRVDAFVKETGAAIIDYDALKLTEVMDLYFKAGPPFASSGKKKAEFPDAVALMSLEAWAEAEGKRILAVTNDGDWAAFASKSSRIDIEEDLADALARLQKDAEAAKDIVADVLAQIAALGPSSVKTEFETLLESEVPLLPALANADAYHAVETEHVSLTYLSFNLDDIAADRDFEIVQAQPDYLVAQINLSLEVEAEGSFRFEAWDSIDGEPINLGSSSATTEATIEVTTLVTFEQEDPTKPWTVSTVELIGAYPTIDFGYIELDYGQWED